MICYIPTIQEERKGCAVTVMFIRAERVLDHCLTYQMSPTTVHLNVSCAIILFKLESSLSPLQLDLRVDIAL